MTTDSLSKLTLLRALLATLIFSPLNGLADEKVISLEIESIVVTGRRDQQNLDQLIGSVGQINSEELDRMLMPILVKLPLGSWSLVKSRQWSGVACFCAVTRLYRSW